MHAVLRQLEQFLRREDGPTAVEYAVMLALIIIVVFAAVQTLGSKANATYSNPTLQNALSTTTGS
jgi:pilus assembly protein Flp/PilA